MKLELKRIKFITLSQSLNTIVMLIKLGLVLEFLIHLLVFKLKLRSWEQKDNELLIFVRPMNFNQYFLH